MTQDIAGPAVERLGEAMEAPLGDLADKKIQGRSPWRLAWERLRRDKVAMGCLIVIILLVLFALAAPLVAKLTGHDPNLNVPSGLTVDGLPKGPSGSYIFGGHDDLGRDVLVRVAYGARISLLIGVVVTFISVGVGVVIGLAAGYYGKIIDTLLARAVDVVLSLPFLLFAISLASVRGASLTNAIVVISFFSWASVARIVRGQVLSVREKEYIEAARSLGAGDIRIMFVDILPNILAPVIVYTTLLIPVVIVTEATLSFLGVGVPPPTADWGSMIDSARIPFPEAWWFLFFPSLALLVATLAFNLFGDGVRDAFDPRGERMLAK